jgi:FAD dependent oxidoreductase TIGR03364
VTRAIIVGGGIVGTLHAIEARLRGWDVVHLDTDPEPQDASVRSPGTVWISTRAPGLELRLALRARELWRSISARAPGVGFRSDGSITVATDPVHLQMFDDVLARDDAERRGIRFLAAGVVGKVNPALRGPLLGGLHCSLDGVMEPRLALAALRRELLAGDGYEFIGGRQVWEVDSGSVIDTNGRVHRGDAVVICPGARSSVLTNMITARAPLQKVKVQMMQTAPFPERLRTLVLDGDGMRYSAGFEVPARERLPAADPVVAEFQVQVQCAQRASGALTIGETHEFEEPFAFDLSERPSGLIEERVAALLGRPVPDVVRRWSGVYYRCTDDRLWYREELAENVFVVTGAGERGLTMAPAIAEDTFDWIEDGVECGGTLPSAARNHT